MQSKKKIIPLLASLSIVAGPVLILTACDITERDMNNLPNGTINNNYKNRVLFSFNGVNFSKTVEQQFKDTYQQGLDFILKYVQGIMAEQNFYEFFHNTLNYSTEQAHAAFDKIKDDLGLSLLTQKYLAGLGTANSLDKVSAQDKNELLFQNQSWHQGGTSIFNYDGVPFYQKENETTKLSNNPNSLFTPENLYKTWDADKEAAFDKQLETVAKHADTSYNDDISTLLNDSKKWTDSTGDDTKQKSLDNSGVPTYQKYLKRFQWWLRFRYQQYYQYEILPELNKTLFTMSYILNNILSIKNDKTTNAPTIKATQNTFITQLQDIEKWDKSKFNLTWNFNTDLETARNVDKKWNVDNQPPAWAEIVNKDKDSKYALNANFFSRMTNGSSPSLNNIDSNFGINGFNSTATNAERSSQWIENNGLHYTNVNTTATFTYTAPIYFLNLIQNLDFSYLMNDGQPKNWIVSTDEMIQKWTNSRNPSINTNFSKYIKGGAESTITQDQKWNIFLQMLYSISTGDTGTENYKTAASNLFPKYIPKNNIYEDGFWKQVKEFYP